MSGFDQRSINETVINMSSIVGNHQKMKLLKQLKSQNISVQEKLISIDRSYLLDDLNANIVRPLRLFEGLEF